MKILITGGAGFVGSNMTSFLLGKGHSIINIDDFSLGKMSYIRPFLSHKKYTLVKKNLLHIEKVKSYFKGVDLVIHLAANSDIGKGQEYTDLDLKKGTIVTYNVLQCMKEHDVKKIIFSSSITVYGMMDKFPIAEDDGPLFPISLYAASKLACESLVSSFSYNYGIQARIFRNANIIGKNSTHGAAYNFANRLKDNDKELVIWGNGKQAKPYIHIDDIIAGFRYAFTHSKKQLNYFNLTTAGSTSVTFLSKTLLKHAGLKKTKLVYTGNTYKRAGDIVKIEVSNKKLKKLGWKLIYENSSEAIVQGTSDVINQFYFKKSNSKFLIF